VTIGLDTSIVVRLLIGHPENQARAARNRIEQAVQQGERVVVCDLVLAETYFALQHHYEVPKGEASSLLARFVDSGLVEVDPPDAARVLGGPRGAGLVDRLIHVRHRELGAVTITFDRKQGTLEGAVRLPAG